MAYAITRDFLLPAECLGLELKRGLPMHEDSSFDKPCYYIVYTNRRCQTAQIAENESNEKAQCELAK